MTYSQIFKEIYYNNKNFLRTYVTICLIFSILAFGSGNIVFASNASTTAEMVGTLGGDFGKMIIPVAQGYLGSIDSSSVFLILSVVSFSLNSIPESVLSSLGDTIGIKGLESLSEYSFGIIDLDAFKIICLIWFLVSKLSKSNKVTYTTGLILENYENKIGAFINLLVSASLFLANIPGITVQAASRTSQLTDIAKYSFNALICFILLLFILIIYLFIRCLFFFVDILLLPVCITVPFFSIIHQLLKIVWIFGFLYIAIYLPYLFAIIAFIVLLIAISFFRKAYITIRYFKNIYVKPFFKRFRGYNSKIPLINPKLPKKVRNFVSDSNANIIIPVYIIKKLSGQKHMFWHDRWWFVSAKDKQYICKPCFIKDNCYTIELNNNSDKKIFIKKSLRFFEIFNLMGNEQNIGRLFHKIHKQLHFVYSKEYYYRFEDIKELTMFTDYTEYKNKRKENIKLTRAEKRQKKLEAKEELRIAKKKKKGLV